MVSVTRIFNFCAGHRLSRPEWTDDQNFAVFGPCANPNGHGHNYSLEVTVSGKINPETGMVLNLRQLETLVQDSFITAVDHKNLNADVAWFANLVPTTENVIEVAWARIAEAIASKFSEARLVSMVLHETPKNRVSKTAD